MLDKGHVEVFNMGNHMNDKEDMDGIGCRPNRTWYIHIRRLWNTIDMKRRRIWREIDVPRYIWICRVYEVCYRIEIANSLSVHPNGIQT